MSYCGLRCVVLPASAVTFPPNAGCGTSTAPPPSTPPTPRAWPCRCRRWVNCCVCCGCSGVCIMGPATSLWWVGVCRVWGFVYMSRAGCVGQWTLALLRGAARHSRCASAGRMPPFHFGVCLRLSPWPQPLSTAPSLPFLNPQSHRPQLPLSAIEAGVFSLIIYFMVGYYR